MMARVMAGLLVALAAAWAGWWVVGSTWRTTALETWLVQRRAAGWTAEAASIRTGGFPNRFDTRIVDLQLANPEDGWAWEVPFVDILTLSWDPTAAIVALPPRQEITLPAGRARLDAQPFRASVRADASPSLPLASFSGEAEGVRVAVDDNWFATAARVSAHLRRLDPRADPDNAYAVYAEALAIELPESLRALVDPRSVLPPVADRLSVDARVTLDAPLDRSALERETPQVQTIGLDRATVHWGPIMLQASGTVSADANGFAEGRLTVTAENWPALLQALVRGGLIGRDLSRTLEFALGFLERPGPSGPILQVPVRFADRVTMVGPVAVGAAPRLRVSW